MRTWHADGKGLLTIDEAQYADVNGMHLLFAIGKRPTRAAIREFAQAQTSVQISHDPSDGSPLHLVAAHGTLQESNDCDQPSQGKTVWLELLRDGLTFDLQGLNPGEPCEFPEFEHRFDMEKSPGESRLEPVKLVPGRHISAAASSIPVTKSMIGLARDLTHHFDDLLAIVWTPSNSVIGRRYFESVSTAWLEGGAFPALGLTAFKETIDGALQSIGLEYWIGQELRVEPPISSDGVAATRLAVRLVNQLILIGGLEESERIIAPDGSGLVMRPSRNRKFVRVWRE